MRGRYPPGPDLVASLRLGARLRTEPLAVALELARLGDLTSFRVGPHRACAASHPDLVREVLVVKANSFRKLPRVMRVLAQLDGNGLALSEGDFWRRQRHLLQPAFATHSLARCADVAVAATRRLLAGWADGAEVDMADAAMRLVLEVLLEALLGVKLAPVQAGEICGAVATLSEVLMGEMGRPFALPGWLPLPGRRRKRRAIGLLRGLFADLVRQGGPGGQALDEVLTLLHAGHETTAAALAWVCYLAARHPEVQASLAEEVDRALGGRPAGLGDLPLLPLAGRVVAEALRLYVPTWTLLPRQAVEDVEVGRYVLPRGTWLFIFPYALHSDPRWFPEPGTFDPERFAPGRVESIPRYAYIPFGAGPHTCLGARLATTMLTLILATVVQGFRLDLAAGQGPPEPEPFLALRPRGGVRLVAARRPRATS
jgi:cytochrome P450